MKHKSKFQFHAVHSVSDKYMVHIIGCACAASECVYISWCWSTWQINRGSTWCASLSSRLLYLHVLCAVQHSVKIISWFGTSSVGWLLHFTWVVDDTKCIVVTRLCVCVCLSVCLSTATCPHYCTDPDVTWQSGRGCPLVVHYWADLQSVHGLRCYGNITRTRNVREYMHVLALCLVIHSYILRES